MLIAQDDYLGHQTPQSFGQAGNGNILFTERYWYTAHPIGAPDVIFDAGLGYYPNRGTMDGFAGITIGRKQHNFRASRQLGSDPLSTTVGSLQFEIVEGGKRHKLTLAENASGISFELYFDAVFPGSREKQNFRERNGVVEEDLARMAQFGRWTGWIKAAGQTFDVRPETWWGQRDRSWGIRSEMKTDEARPPVAKHQNFFWTWSMLQFENSAISVFAKERVAGKPYYLSGGEYRRLADGSIQHREITSFEHEIEWAPDPLGQTIDRAVLKFGFDSGPSRLVEMKGRSIRFYLKAGMYGGFQGWTHGDDKGACFEHADVWDLEDKTTRRIARTLSDHVMALTSDGETGVGISEYGVAEGYARYTEPQAFPAM